MWRPVVRARSFNYAASQPLSRKVQGKKNEKHETAIIIIDPPPPPRLASWRGAMDEATTAASALTATAFPH